MSLGDKCFKGKSTTKSNKTARFKPFASQRGKIVKRRRQLKGGVDANAFDPLDITGLQLWLRADNAIDTFVADGDVTAWSDESGNDNDCTVPSTAARRPHYKENVFGTKPAILFTGSNDEHLDTTGINTLFPDDDADSDYTVILMIKPTGVATDNQAIFSQYSSTNWASTASTDVNRLAMGIDVDSKSTILGKSTTGDVAIGDTLVDDTSYIMVARHEYASTTMRNYLNGTMKSKVTDWVRGNGSIVPAHPTIGLQYTSGRGGTTYTNEYTGYIAEIIVYNTAISERNLNDVQNYLLDKYSLSKMPRPRLG